MAVFAYTYIGFLVSAFKWYHTPSNELIINTFIILQGKPNKSQMVYVELEAFIKKNGVVTWAGTR